VIHIAPQRRPTSSVEVTIRKVHVGNCCYDFLKKTVTLVIKNNTLGLWKQKPNIKV